MVETIVKFETAKLAYEKGFNSSEYWSEMLMYDTDGELCKIVLGKQLFQPEPFNKGFILAPSQSLLMKWLRETHHTIVLPRPVMGRKNGYDSFPIIGWDYDVLSTVEGQNSYYMGYPVLNWYTADIPEEEFEEGETLADFNVEPFAVYEDALERGIFTTLMSLKDGNRM